MTSSRFSSNELIVYIKYSHNIIDFLSALDIHGLELNLTSLQEYTILTFLAAASEYTMLTFLAAANKYTILKFLQLLLISTLSQIA